LQVILNRNGVELPSASLYALAFELEQHFADQQQQEEATIEDDDDLEEVLHTSNSEPPLVEYDETTTDLTVALEIKMESDAENELAEDQNFLAEDETDDEDDEELDESTGDAEDEEEEEEEDIQLRDLSELKDSRKGRKLKKTAEEKLFE